MASNWQRMQQLRSQYAHEVYQLHRNHHQNNLPPQALAPQNIAPIRNSLLDSPENYRVFRQQQRESDRREEETKKMLQYRLEHFFAKIPMAKASQLPRPEPLRPLPRKFVPEQQSSSVLIASRRANSPTTADSTLSLSCTNSSDDVTPLELLTSEPPMPPRSPPTLPAQQMQRQFFTSPHLQQQHPLPQHPLPQHPLTQHPLPQHPLPHHPLPQHPLPHHPLPQHPLPHHPLPQHPLPHHPLPQHPLPHHPLPLHQIPQHQLPQYPEQQRQQQQQQPQSRSQPQLQAWQPQQPRYLRSASLTHLTQSRLTHGSSQRQLAGQQKQQPKQIMQQFLPNIRAPVLPAQKCKPVPQRDRERYSMPCTRCSYRPAQLRETGTAPVPKPRYSVTSVDAATTSGISRRRRHLSASAVTALTDVHAVCSYPSYQVFHVTDVDGVNASFITREDRRVLKILSQFDCVAHVLDTLSISLKRRVSMVCIAGPDQQHLHWCINRIQSMFPDWELKSQLRNARGLTEPRVGFDRNLMA